MVWNAAGRYDLDPPFFALGKDGTPDLYLNTVIGLSLKWLDSEEMNRFYLSYQSAAQAESFDTAVWLTLENWLFHKELPDRPVLASLRKAHAKAFLDLKGTLSRQEMMLKDMRVYEQEEYRWATVLGEKPPFLTPRARELAAMLNYEDPEADTEAVIDRLKDVLVRGFRFSSFTIDASEGSYVSGPLRDVLSRMLRHEVRHTDSLLTRNAWGLGAGEDPGVTGGGGLRRKHVPKRTAEDREYIEACFGPCIYPEHDMKRLEQELCRDSHEYCGLWVSAAAPAAEQVRLKEAVLVGKQAREAALKNRAFYERSRLGMEASVRKLSAELETILSSYMQPLPVTSRKGALDVEKSWRLGVLNDPLVFTRPGDETENSLTVDILLDASASRMRYQQEIASQAYVLAKSLSKVRIRTRILAFHSLRGYTVLQILKDHESPDLTGIFRYYAAGWNRDGLALRAAGRLMEQAADRNEKRILLILTDANPCDSTKMPPQEGSIFDREYANAEAVMETRNAVRKLTEDRICVGAVYTGPTTHVGNLRTIYGDSFVRVQKIGQLSAGISSLLQRILRGLKN